MSNELGVDFSFFTSDEASKIDMNEDTTKKPASKKRTRKKSTDLATTTEISRSNAENLQYANALEEPYARSFAETQNALKCTVIQTDELLNRINEDIEAVRSSKTLKNKYVYLTNLTGSASSLIGAKLQGIREMNTTIKSCHELELKRQQALHMDKAEQNDDMKMMAMYDAFVNAPVGVYQNASVNNRPTTVADMVGMHGVTITGGDMSTTEMTPEQNRMRLENNPNIQEVVKFNQSTGERFFDVVDKTTGASIPNYPRPDSFLLNDTTIDVRAGIARNRNIDQVWPLIVIGNSDY